MTGRLPRRFSEPGFTRASIRFAQAISDELIYAADLARPAWTELASAYPDDLARIPEDLTQNPALFRTPLVWGFAVIWAKSLRWPVSATYRDGIEIKLPADILREMEAHGRLDALEFFLAGPDDVCCGRLGSNDHDLRYGLYVNVPIWIQLGVEPQWRDWFNRQLRMVIFHETAHFRWIGDELRNEHMAHARGVASLRTGAWPSDRAAMAALLEREHPEAWHNPEIRGLIQETSGGARISPGLVGPDRGSDRAETFDGRKSKAYLSVAALGVG